MLSVPGTVKIFLCLAPTDMRKSIDGLAGLASNVLRQDPLSGHLFVFLGKRRDRLKLLYFDGDGYALWYGRTSEKLDPAQLALFDTSPEEPVPQLPAPAPRPTATTSSVAKAGRHGRRRLPDQLKRVEKVYDLTPAEKELLGGEANLVKIGQEVTEQLEWEPSSLYVIRHVQLTYARREPAAAAKTTDQASSDQAVADHSVGHEPVADDQRSSAQPPSPARPTIITAAKPPQPIPGGLPGPGLLAHVSVSKYVDHLPLHRQERQFARHGLELSRQTTCDWALAGAKLLSPLYDLAKQVALASRVMHLDATRVKVCDAQKS